MSPAAVTQLDEFRTRARELLSPDDVAEVRGANAPMLGIVTETSSLSRAVKGGGAGATAGRVSDARSVNHSCPAGDGGAERLAALTSGSASGHHSVGRVARAEPNIVVAPTWDDLSALPDAELEDLVVATDRQLRVGEVTLAMATREMARRGSFWRDGHATIAAWCRGRLRWAAKRAKRVARNGEAFELLPDVCAAARNGAVPVDHLDELGAVVANRRVHPHLADADHLFAELATRLLHWEWRSALQRWMQLADADGAEQRHAAAHEHRHARVTNVGEVTTLEAAGGTLEGAFMAEVLDRFIEAEFLADCDEAKDRLGTDRVSAADLARTHRQRSFDALLAIFKKAASTDAIAGGVDPLVNVIVDDDTAARLMRLVAGESTTPKLPAAFLEHRCETIDGVPLSESAAAAAILAGRLRRVLVAPDGVVIDLGRQRRLFTGAARDAAMLANQRCLWPGCEVRTGRCETDHLIEWSRGGTTSPRNAGRACRHHNLFRTSHGYRVYRDDRGRWHVHRPDGSEITETSAIPEPARAG